MRGLMFAAMMACCVLFGLGDADAQRRRASGAWSATETVDPITGVRRCVVAAYDRTADSSFSRTGYLYPFVESHSESGVLVGVSSGGRFRLPTGDILWRVDQLPHRELRAVDSPITSPIETPAAPAGIPAEAMQQMTEYQQRLIQAATSTTTMAGGERAQEMLREMLAGTSLIFRAAGAAPEHGLPHAGQSRVGQVTNEGLRPFPLDDSFRAGLAQCGIDVAPEPPPSAQ